MVTLRQIWTDSITLFHPEGHPEAMNVAPGQTIEVPGDLAAEQPHTDGIVVDNDGQLSAYGTALWEHVPVDGAPAWRPDGAQDPEAEPEVTGPVPVADVLRTELAPAAEDPAPVETTPAPSILPNN